MSSTGGSSVADRCCPDGDPPPSPVSIVPGTPSAGRSTEEIWKDINLSYLKEQDRHGLGHLPAMNFLEWFPGGVLCQTLPGMNMERQGRNRGPSPASLSLGAPSSAATTDPATCLSLYWAPSDPSPASSFYKRGLGDASTADSEDKRRKRRMKNRESADRSRARKQAYTNELENEVALLRKENAWLRSQQEKKMWPAVPSSDHHRRNHRHHHEMPAHPQKMKKLQRTSTAPF
ncbi:hypothetical protein MLD38_035011 [Melastoma candidum]|uniref:Uncharacterized protein n=1 Tax=Melastoma candidum TaxID=119954 RepID=A0ACB9MCA7_9MYRT|nr:hypothetical protein MLD38_035011 [Melastoma candidum]